MLSAKQRENYILELEGRIADTEKRIAELEESMGSYEVYSDSEKARETAGDHAAARNELEELYGEWEELMEQE